MAILASYTEKADYTGPEVTITATGAVQFFAYGDLGQAGQVQLLVKAADDEFYPYPSLTIYAESPDPLEVSLMADDVVKVLFHGCVSAGAELRA